MNNIKPEQWFKNRIGKRIYRLNKTNCCEHCDKVYEEGLIIHNDLHAHELYIVQLEMGHRYEDKKEQK